jgi:hypothetical protein
MSGSGECGGAAAAARFADANSERLCSSELRLEPLLAAAAAVERARAAAGAAASASRGLSAVGLVVPAWGRGVGAWAAHGRRGQQGGAGGARHAFGL